MAETQVKEVKVKVVEEFRDRTKDYELRKKGDTFMVEEERAKILEGRKLVEIVESPKGKGKETGEKAGEENPEKAGQEE